MTPNNSSALRVGRTNTGYVVYVEGRGTMRESSALCDFAIGCVEDEECTLAVDLSRCDYLDSTFLGCLVSLNKRFGRPSAGRYTIVADEDRSRYLLATAHLHTVLPVEKSPPSIIAECFELRPATIEREELGRHVMECHRRLAELDGPNQAVFKRIADQLAAELEGNT